MTEFLSKLVEPNSDFDTLDRLKTENIPLVMWGGGSMSYSVRKILKKTGIQIDACWIDNAENMKDIEGIPVMGLDAIIKKFHFFNVVFGHSKYELADSIIKNPAIHKCYCLVNVCYEQWEHLSYGFVKDHAEEYFATYELLEDGLSKECLVAWLNCKITEDFHYLLSVSQEKASYFEQPFFEISGQECIADIGAYNGDTIREFLDTSNTYRSIYAIEPQEQSFMELQQYIEDAGLEGIELYKCGCWNSDTVLRFYEDEESSGFGVSGKNKLQVYCLDNLLKEKLISIIKINFLHGVCETLEGARNIIIRQKPRLIITVGFDEWGLINVPKTIMSLNSEYKLSLRFAAAMPARLILYAY